MSSGDPGFYATEMEMKHCCIPFLHISKQHKTVQHGWSGIHYRPMLSSEMIEASFRGYVPYWKTP